WLLEQSDPNVCANNVRVALRIEGQLDVEKLKQALSEIVARHEILRTRIVVENEFPIQLIADSNSPSLDVCDLTDYSDSKRESEIQRILSLEANTPFDLAVGPLFRVRQLKLEDREHILVLTLHHIICDAWSIGIFLRELITLYQGEAGLLSPLPIQYADF